MDRFESTTDIIIALNQYNTKAIDDSNFITKVCSFFDGIKVQEIAHSDKQFLLYLANVIGIPHYFDMLLLESDQSASPEMISLSTFSSFLYESSLTLNGGTKVHRYQKEIYDLFSNERTNRFFLSASTSFGKTFLVYEVIKKMRYEKVLLIFPTIALLAENLEKLKEDNNYIFFRDNYRIHTLSDTLEDTAGNHIFLFTPERYLSFVDKNPDMPPFDFCFVDEVYKIDNDYIIDEEARENDRDIAYRLATYEIFSNNPQADSLLVGPYIKLPETSDDSHSFHRFLNRFNITPIDRNAIEIVNKSRYNVPVTTRTQTFEDLTFDFSSGNGKKQRMLAILREIHTKGENAIIYCSRKDFVENNAISLQELNIPHNFDNYEDFISHIETQFSPEWIVPKALKNGIGIHHGVVPKYIQKEIINLFNKGFIKFLFSTTTITEGVNTTAKNIVILQHKKGNKILKHFDAKNIEGRAGRFLSHYKGRVIVLEPLFQAIIDQEGEDIKHKNYDISSPKDDIDLDITSEEYLTPENINRKEYLNQLQRQRSIPDSILGQFRSISRADKISVYDKIINLSVSQHAAILELIRKVNYPNPGIDFEGLQVVISTFEDIVRDDKLTRLIGRSEYGRVEPAEFSRITYKLHYYLRDGFPGAVDFESSVIGSNINKAIRDASEFVYNILKYQLVKYLGVFNAMYKYERSLHLDNDIEEVRGIDRLLIKLEYNAYSESAKIASDYGAPYNVIKFFDSDERTQRGMTLDAFETQIKNKISSLILNRES